MANSPGGLSATKRLLVRASEAEIDRRIELAVAESVAIRSTADFREGLAAFLEKREPSWSGGRMSMDISAKRLARVRYEETDQMGVVYYGNYFTYFEIGRVEYMRERGIAYKEMEQRGRQLHRGGRIALPLPAAGALRRHAAHPHARGEARRRTSALRTRLCATTSGELLATGETAARHLQSEGRPKSLPEKYRDISR